MTEQRIPHSSVHQDMDPHFFTDYALFSGAFRHYIAKSIKDAYGRDQNDIHKRLLTVGEAPDNCRSRVTRAARKHQFADLPESAKF